MQRYVLNVLVALSQLANALTAGDPDETLSSRAGKRHPTLARIVNALFFFDERHCYKASLRDEDEGKYSVPSTQRWQVWLLWLTVLVLVVAFRLYDNRF